SNNSTNNTVPAPDIARAYRHPTDTLFFTVVIKHRVKRGLRHQAPRIGAVGLVGDATRRAPSVKN
ncbi:hypothetical protein F441_16491, partial [Phytophthora nicotianae CJ01A1]